MKVRMRVDVSGTRNGQEWPRRGQVMELPDDEAVQYCANGMAEPIADTGEAETAVAPPAETRTALKTSTGPTKQHKAKQ